MSQTQPYKILFYILLALLLPLITFLVTQLLQRSGELDAIREDQEFLVAKINKMEEENRYIQEYLKRLEIDPEFKERIAREKLGHANPNDLIFRFESEK